MAAGGFKEHKGSCFFSRAMLLLKLNRPILSNTINCSRGSKRAVNHVGGCDDVRDC